MPFFDVVRQWAQRKGVTPGQFSLGWLQAQKPFTSKESRQIEMDLSKVPVVGPRELNPATSQNGVEAPPTHRTLLDRESI
jgi:aryl-alcohol dehydrogenase-like predicted oxidoreductase